MSVLSLRVQKTLEVEPEAAVGAVATLRRIPEEGAPVSGGSRLDVTIPANFHGGGKRVAVEPGRWLVEATLPSGETLSEEVGVAAGEEVAVTLRAAEHSPHEWLGWQHLVGNVEGDRTRRNMEERAGEELLTMRGPRAVTRGLRDPLPHGEPRVGLPDHRALRGASAWEGVLDVGGIPVVDCSYAERDATSYLYHFANPTSPGGRDFAHVSWGGERCAVSLPLPWRDVNGQTVPAQMVVRLHPRDKMVHLGVAVLDREFGTLAGLMTASTLPKAKIVVEQARGMLFEKINNPLAAAAGGYVLLATGGSEKDSAWHSWIENLHRWFPYLPDGAVLLASLRLRYPTGTDALQEARAALLAAFDRGIPYYSAGVAWLLDGLTSFAADDAEVERKMRLVQRVALCLDSSQAFTVLRVREERRRRP